MGHNNPEVFLEVQKTLADLKMLMEHSSTVLDVQFTFSKLSLSFGSLSPEQPSLWSGDNCLFVLTGTTTVCSSNKNSCISDMKQNFFIRTF